MKYHQSNKSKNDARTTVLNKVEDEYDYSNISFPASCDDIATFRRATKSMHMRIRDRGGH